MKEETLRKVLDKIPDDYDVRYQDKNIDNNFEIDLDNKKIILK